MSSRRLRAAFATLASLWFAWFVVLGCARPGACFTQKSCCCESSRAVDATAMRAEMPCCRVVTRAVTARVPVTPSPLPPSLVPAASPLPAPSARLVAQTVAAPRTVAAPLYRTKCALLL